MLERIRQETAKDQAMARMLERVRDGTTRRFWLEDGVLYAKGRRPFVPNSGGLRRLLLKETHDALWARHPGQERTMALLASSYFWPSMEKDAHKGLIPRYDGPL